jgi:hypothetical protein
VRYIKAVRPHLECDFTPDGERKGSMKRIERDWIILVATSGSAAGTLSICWNVIDELDAVKKIRTDMKLMLYPFLKPAARHPGICFEYCLMLVKIPKM